MYNRVEYIELIGVFTKSQKNKTKQKLTMIQVRFRHCGCAELPLYAFGGDQVNGTTAYYTCFFAWFITDSGIAAGVTDKLC